MIVYHGSTMTVDKPSIGFSKRHLDFGVGFYITDNRSQAESWAKRKAIRQNGKPIINIYDLSDELSTYRGLVFANEDSAWLDFVARCRKGEPVYKDYDYISGSVANDDVFVTVDMYTRGIWDAARALSEIRYYKTSHQICLISQQLIDNELIFTASCEVK